MLSQSPLCLQNQSFTLLYYPANPANVAPQARPQPQRQMLTPAASYLYHTVLYNTLFSRGCLSSEDAENSTPECSITTPILSLLKGPPVNGYMKGPKEKGLR